MDSGQVRERAARSTVAVGIGAVVVSLLLVVTATIASTYTAQRVAENARALHWANGALGTASIARASIGQAVFFAVDHTLGVASDEAVADAVATARHDLQAVALLASGSGSGEYEPPQHLTGPLEAFVTNGERVLQAIDDGQMVGAADLKATDVDNSFEFLTAALATQQQVVSGAISATETLAGHIDTITRVLVMLALPTIAFTIYRRRAKRSLLAAERRHASEIEIERRAATAKDELFAAVSHELRTPLTSILGFSSVLVDGGIDPGETTEMLGIIRSDAIELERRIDDIVATTRAAGDNLHINRVPADPEAIARAAAAATSTSKEVTFEFEESDLETDPTALKQILRNLVSNADRHGGATIWVTGRRVGGAYLISVSDDGPGFEHPPIAQGGFAHDPREAIIAGTVGLGLSAACALAVALGGEIRHRRSAGWTQVGVLLPAEAIREDEPSITITDEQVEVA